MGRPSVPVCHHVVHQKAKSMDNYCSAHLWGLLGKFWGQRMHELSTLGSERNLRDLAQEILRLNYWVSKSGSEIKLHGDHGDPNPSEFGFPWFLVYF